MTNCQQGNYNINNLPVPPPFRSGFEYLPAPRPSTEDRRLEVCKNVLSFGPKWNKERIHTLILSAKSHFNAKHASLSFFNPDYELFFAETGYKSDALHRQVSIGSHALLTQDVLVLLDARKVCWNHSLYSDRPRGILYFIASGFHDLRPKFSITYYSVLISTNSNRIGGSRTVQSQGMRRK
jgi:hypothetical protein